MSVNQSSIWKIMFIALATANLTGFAGWLMFGMDSVKHAEIDQIMATRAPYIHDKQRIDERMSRFDEDIRDLNGRVKELEKK